MIQVIPMIRAFSYNERGALTQNKKEAD